MALVDNTTTLSVRSFNLGVTSKPCYRQTHLLNFQSLLTLPSSFEVGTCSIEVIKTAGLILTDPSSNVFKHYDDKCVAMEEVV